jgi:hypothetical protein
MRAMMSSLSVLALTGSALAGSTGSAPAPAPEPYRPLAFLVGHCWKGTFPDGKVTDEHCFSWIYGGKFVRDEHVVRGGAHEGRGESIYVWDGAAHELQYLYIESGGGFSRGTVGSEGETLVFPPSRYLENGKTQTYRSRWLPQGEDAYEVNTEFEVQDRWVSGFKMRMQRVAAAAKP